MKRNQTIMLVGVVATLLTGCSRKVLEQNPESVSSQVALDWNVAAYDAMGGPAYQHSLLASRINAMVHIAIHDAVNAVVGKYEQYTYLQSVPDADVRIAAAYAGHTVLVASFPDKKSMLDSVLARSTAAIAQGDANARAKGMQVGKDAGNAILANRAGDGADINPIVKIEPSATPGVYNVVPPFDFIFAPHWKTMKLFGLERHDQFRPVPPPSLNSKEYQQGFDEVKSIGRLNSITRTADETFFAKYWYEFSEAGWNRVARTVISDKKLNLVESARLLALVNIAMADAYSAGWDAKIHYNFWRPYTAIRAAAKDQNDLTDADSQWEPLMPTPPIHDYPSTHSALGNAAAQVLIELLGNATPFTMPSVTAEPANATRSFRSFSEAADENAASRVVAGIHFRFSCDAGQKLGEDIGKFVVENYLRKK